jgi:hypothetical protein
LVALVMSNYLTDNVFVEAFLYEKKNGYFSFICYFQRKNVFFFQISVHDKIKGHSRHQGRYETNIDRKNHLVNVSGSELVNHLLQQGFGHGAHRHEDSAGCCDVSQH